MDINSVNGIQNREASISQSNELKTKDNTDNISKILEEKEKDIIKYKKEKEGKNTIKEKEVQETIDDMNKILDVLNQKISIKVFEGHEKNKEYYIALIDKETEKIVKEIPSKEVLEMRNRIQKYVGTFMDEKV